MRRRVVVPPREWIAPSASVDAQGALEAGQVPPADPRGLAVAQLDHRSAAVVAQRHHVVETDQLGAVNANEVECLEPLLEAGELPNLARLMADGASGPLRSLEPRRKSPVIWTTIATGRSPDDR